MKKFIELTQGNNKVLVNISAIVRIRPSDSGCAVLLIGKQEAFIVNEQYDDIRLELDKAASILKPKNSDSQSN